MIKCPKCNELIGDTVVDCPICKTHLTEEYRQKAYEQNARIHEEAITNAMKEYAKRTKYEMIIAVIMVLLAVIGLSMIAVFDLNVVYGIVLFVVVLLIYGVGVWRFRIGLCPYCESVMGRGFFFRTHCSRCGGKLR